jgi:hypothetical protein
LNEVPKQKKITVSDVRGKLILGYYFVSWVAFILLEKGLR